MSEIPQPPHQLIAIHHELEIELTIILIITIKRVKLNILVIKSGIK